MACPSRLSGSLAASFITSARAAAIKAAAAEFVEHIELAGNVRLEGKLMQQTLAEGMDRLDLEAAGRLQRLREEPPRRLHLVGRRSAAL